MAAQRLTADLAAQLERVETSHDRSFRYAPCSVTLRSGEVLPRVYVAEEAAYLGFWGDDPSRPMVDLAEVEIITESPERLPAELADEVYAVGESGMGYVVFTVRLRDGREVPFSTGNAVDFLDWPTNVSALDAVAVMPNTGREFFIERDGGGRRGADYLWCLYRA